MRPPKHLVALDIEMNNPETFIGAGNKAASKRTPRLTAEDTKCDRQGIDEWRTFVFQRDYRGSCGFTVYNKEAVMSDKRLLNLVSECAKVEAPEFVIGSLINWSARFPSYLKDLTGILMDLNAARQRRMSLETDDIYEPQLRD
ncbi:hypothetical protein BGZ72_001939 [Mortierella alpina]|nr:hypothetical protein BGZ72_001939 [Mortierella alpina]